MGTIKTLEDENLFSSEDKKLIKNTILNRSINDKASKMIPLFEDLKSAVKRYRYASDQYRINSSFILSTYNHLLNMRQQVQTAINNNQQVDCYDQYELGYNNIVEIVRIETQNFYKELLNFQHALNRFLGQEMVLTLVSPNGNIYLITQEKYEKIFSYSLTSSTGQIEAGFSDIDNIIGTLKEDEYATINIEDLMKKELDSDLPRYYRNLNWARGSSLRRLEIAKEVRDKFKEADKPTAGARIGKSGTNITTTMFILWHSPRNGLAKWTRIYANRGSVEEAYAYVIFQHEEYKFNKTDLGYLLDILLLDIMEPKVDNAKGRLNGDITYSLEGQRIELAVKTNKASMASIQQFDDILKVVEKLIDKGKSAADIKQELQKIQTQDKDEGRQITKVVDDLTEYMSKQLESEIEDKVQIHEIIELFKSTMYNF